MLELGRTLEYLTAESSICVWRNGGPKSFSDTQSSWRFQMSCLPLGHSSFLVPRPFAHHVAAVGEPCWARGAGIPFQVLLETSNEELGGLEAAWTKTQEGWWALLMLRPTQDCPKGQVK